MSGMTEVLVRPARLGRRSPQAGSSLIVVMIMLTVISAIGVISARLALFSERSARNDRDQQIAFQGAEAALLDAELDTMGPNTSTDKRVCKFLPGQNGSEFVAGCGSGTKAGLCTSLTIQGEAWKDVKAEYSSETGTSSTNKTAEYGQFTGQTLPSGSIGLSAKKPRYTIERVSATVFDQNKKPAGVDDAYLVTAMGFGIREETRVVLQTLIYKPAHKPNSGC
jgi:type IV pilus assembly protein PilX